jgi:ATP-dependent protease ClpP protease subunit
MRPSLVRLIGLSGRRRPVAPVAGEQRPWYRVTAAKGTDDESVIQVYDTIGGGWYGGVNAADFVRDVAAIESSRIRVHINSGGGDVFDAVSMHAALVNHPASVTTVVDGLAASAASFLAMAGDRIEIEKPARMMIHDALMVTIGNEAEHLEAASLLSAVSDSIAEMYADRTGRDDTAAWRSRMRSETWYSAAQAVDAGLADAVRNDVSRETSDPEDRRSQLIRARARARVGE